MYGLPQEYHVYSEPISCMNCVADRPLMMPFVSVDLAEKSVWLLEGSSHFSCVKAPDVHRVYTGSSVPVVTL